MVESGHSKSIPRSLSLKLLAQSSFVLASFSEKFSLCLATSAEKNNSFP